MANLATLVYNNGMSEANKHSVPDPDQHPPVEVDQRDPRHLVTEMGSHDALLKSANLTGGPLEAYDKYIQDPEIRDRLPLYRAFIEEYCERRDKINLLKGEEYESAQTKFYEEFYDPQMRELQKALGCTFDEFQDLLKRKKNECFGFTPEDVAHVTSLYKDFCEKEYGEKSTKNYAIEAYMPLVSVILKTFGHDLRGRTLVEVGPGQDGIYILKFLQSLGATVIGIDSNQYLAFNDIIRHGLWQELSKTVEPGSADMIFTHHMTPDSYVDPTEAEKEREMCMREMDTCLKPGGMLLGHRVGSDVGMPMPSFWEVPGYCPQVRLSKLQYKDPDMGNIELEIKQK